MVDEPISCRDGWLRGTATTPWQLVTHAGATGRRRVRPACDRDRRARLGAGTRAVERRRPATVAPRPGYAGCRASRSSAMPSPGGADLVVMGRHGNTPERPLLLALPPMRYSRRRGGASLFVPLQTGAGRRVLIALRRQSPRTRPPGAGVSLLDLTGARARLRDLRPARAGAECRGFICLAGSRERAGSRPGRNGSSWRRDHATSWCAGAIRSGRFSTCSESTGADTLVLGVRRGGAPGSWARPRWPRAPPGGADRGAHRPPGGGGPRRAPRPTRWTRCTRRASRRFPPRPMARATSCWRRAWRAAGQGLRPHLQRDGLGSRGGEKREGLGLQRPGARPADPRARRRPGARQRQERAARSRRRSTSTASRCPTTRTACRSSPSRRSSRASFTYEFTVPNAGSHMYHSHHNSAEAGRHGPARRVHRRAEGPQPGARRPTWTTS